MSKRPLDLFKELHVEIVELNNVQSKAYMYEWFDKIVPADKKQQAFECYCFSKDGFCGYLWHVFSYELLEHLQSNNARRAFDKTKKQNVVLISSLDDKVFLIKDATLIKSTAIDEMDDVILTSSDFKWTYAKTHERNLGPYFFSGCTV